MRRNYQLISSKMWQTRTYSRSEMARLNLWKQVHFQTQKHYPNSDKIETFLTFLLKSRTNCLEHRISKRFCGAKLKIPERRLFCCQLNSNKKKLLQADSFRRKKNWTSKQRPIPPGICGPAGGVVYYAIILLSIPVNIRALSINFWARAPK